MNTDRISLWIDERLERALPSAAHDGDLDARQRARTLLLMCWLLLPIGVLFAILFHGILGAHTVGLAIDMLTGCVVVAWALAVTQGAHRTGASVLAAAAWFVVSWGMAATGGFISPFTPFLLVVVVLANNVLPRRLSILVGLGHGVTALGFYALDLFNVPLKSSMSTDAGSLFMALGLAFSMFVIVATSGRQVASKPVSESREAELLARVEEAEAKADAARRVRQVFLTIMSHELRTPLNAVFASLEMMKTRGHYDSETPKYMRRMEMATHSLLGVINDTIDWSRLESGALKLEIDEADPADLARRVVDTLRDRADQRGLRVRVQVLPGVPRTMVTDSRRVLQALLSLVGNSLAFTAVGSVTVKVSRYGQEIRYEIVDTGPGIPESALAALFDPWERTNPSHHRRPRGAGLGLAISARFIRVLGGRIHAESEMGHGTTIYVDLPVETLVEAADAEPAPYDPRSFS